MQNNLLVIGECMLEVSGSLSFHQASQLNFGGDVLNSAVYYSRLSDSKVGFLTALGDDQLSGQMISAFNNENIDTTAIIRLKNTLPGLYAIQTDEQGERFFYYWRDNAPVKSLFLNIEQATLLNLSATYSDIYLSGISLSRWDDGQLDLLYQWLELHKKNYHGRVIFDLNYRPRCWDNTTKAKQTLTRFFPLCDIVITTFDDEKLLYSDCDAMETIKRYQNYGVDHIVIKQGSLPTLCCINKQLISVRPKLKIARPVDTTAAGDSFNAAYLGALAYNMDIRDACDFAQRFAAEVIQHKGAIIDKQFTIPYCNKLQQYANESQHL